MKLVSCRVSGFSSGHEGDRHDSFFRNWSVIVETNVRDRNTITVNRKFGASAEISVSVVRSETPQGYDEGVRVDQHEKNSTAELYRSNISDPTEAPISSDNFGRQDMVTQRSLSPDMVTPSPSRALISKFLASLKYSVKTTSGSMENISTAWSPRSETKWQLLGTTRSANGTRRASENVQFVNLDFASAIFPLNNSSFQNNYSASTIPNNLAAAAAARLFPNRSHRVLPLFHPAVATSNHLKPYRLFHELNSLMSSGKNSPLFAAKPTQNHHPLSQLESNATPDGPGLASTQVPREFLLNIVGKPEKRQTGISQSQEEYSRNLTNATDFTRDEEFVDDFSRLPSQQLKGGKDYSTIDEVDFDYSNDIPDTSFLTDHEEIPVWHFRYDEMGLWYHDNYSLRDGTYDRNAIDASDRDVYDWSDSGGNVRSDDHGSRRDSVASDNDTVSVSDKEIGRDVSDANSVGGNDTLGFSRVENLDIKDDSNSAFNETDSRSDIVSLRKNVIGIGPLPRAADLSNTARDTLAGSSDDRGGIPGGGGGGTSGGGGGGTGDWSGRWRGAGDRMGRILRDQYDYYVDVVKITRPRKPRKRFRKKPRNRFRNRPRSRSYAF